MQNVDGKKRLNHNNQHVNPRVVVQVCNHNFGAGERVKAGESRGQGQVGLFSQILSPKGYWKEKRQGTISADVCFYLPALVGN